VSIHVAALVPVKDPGRGKSRLHGVLDAAERAALNAAMARRTLEVCAAVFGSARTFVVTASSAIEAEARVHGMPVVAESAPGDLNAALRLAGSAAMAAGAQALLVVPTDLARIDEDSIRRVVDVLRRAGEGMVVVPDRHASGTNLLGVVPARIDLFRFGEHSLDKHLQAARDAGLTGLVHEDALLALDLDLPEDLALWRGGA